MKMMTLLMLGFSSIASFGFASTPVNFCKDCHFCKDCKLEVSGEIAYQNSNCGHCPCEDKGQEENKKL